MISHQSHGEGPISLVKLSFFNYMRVKWLVVIVLALGLLLWLWIDFMVLGPGRCFWQRNSTNPSRRVECNTDSRLFHCDRGRRLAGCRFVLSSKDIFVVIFLSHPPPIVHSISAGDVPGTCQDRLFYAFLSHDWDFLECSSAPSVTANISSVLRDQPLVCIRTTRKQ